MRLTSTSGNLTTNIEVEVIVHNDLSAEVHIGPDEAAWYAKFSELGTAPHEESSPRGTKPFMHPGEPPRPWLRPAFANTADAQLEALVNNIKDGLEDVVGK